MKKITLLLLVFLYPFFAKSQIQLGGYVIYDHLVTAVHPNGCDPSYVTNIPDDSIWVNFFNNDSMTGNFSQPSIDAAGDDLLLETGFHASNYTVSLLLSTGLYSASHSVTLPDWLQLADTMWQHLFTTCGPGTFLAEHFILPLDFNVDFGLTASDTVTGIKIIFLTTTGAPDFAGAYIINPQPTGIHEHGSEKEVIVSPNPFSDKINITTGNNDLSEISLYDIAFRKLVHKKFTNSVSLSTTHLAKGIYIYVVKNKHGMIRKGKVEKE